MIVLGIETTCDETAAAVVGARGRARRDPAPTWCCRRSPSIAAYGGVVPEIAARAHVEALDHLIAHAMTDAEIPLSALDGIAAAAGPGLIGGVIVGLTTAKAIALVAESR